MGERLEGSPFTEVKAVFYRILLVVVVLGSGPFWCQQSLFGSTVLLGELFFFFFFFGMQRRCFAICVLPLFVVFFNYAFEICPWFLEVFHLFQFLNIQILLFFGDSESEANGLMMWVLDLVHPRGHFFCFLLCSFSF